MRMTRDLAILTLAGLVLVVLALSSVPGEMRREDEAACAGEGFHPGAAGFDRCLRQERIAARDAYWPGWANPWS